MSILGIILFVACSGISGEEDKRAPIVPQKQLKKHDLDSIHFFYNRSHRIKRRQKALKRS